MFDKPVLLIVFNRPSTTQKVFEAIRVARPKKLYVSGDAPRADNVTDRQKCEEVKTIVNQVDWDCEVKYKFSSENLGCSLGPRSAFQWFFSHESEGIILEDDCVPNLSFFSFCGQMLDQYRDNPKIVSINGSNLGYKSSSNKDYFFSRYMNMWGWATWKDRSDRVDYQLQKWNKTRNKSWWLFKHTRKNVLDFDLGWIQYWMFQFNATVKRPKITWWDYQWIYFQLSNRLYSVVPAKNLVSNIGFNEEGHHTLFEELPAAGLPVEELNGGPYIPSTPAQPDLEYEEKYVKRIWCNYIRKPLWYQVGRQIHTWASEKKWERK